MLSLAFDTTMARCAVAIGDENTVLAARNEAMGRGQAEALLPLIQALLGEAGIGFDDIDRICVTTGPGSFTGVRIGVAAAKGLSLARDIPIIAMTTLEVVAAQASQSMEAPGDILVAQDARRGEVYVQRFRNSGQLPLTSLSDASALALSEAECLAQDCLLAGTGARLLQGGRIAACDHEVDARTMLRLAPFYTPMDHKALHPLYLRPPDAKVPVNSPIAALRQKLG